MNLPKFKREKIWQIFKKGTIKGLPIDFEIFLQGYSEKLESHKQNSPAAKGKKVEGIIEKIKKR